MEGFTVGVGWEIEADTTGSDLMLLQTSLDYPTRVYFINLMANLYSKITVPLILKT